MSPLFAIPVASLSIASATSIRVNVLSRYKKPWAPLAVTARPPTSPAELMAPANVPVASSKLSWKSSARSAYAVQT
jgi:hypothetical protein